MGATISELLELFCSSALLLDSLITTPYLGVTIEPKLLLEFSSEVELATFGLSLEELEATCSAEELEVASAAELAAEFADASLELGCSTEELDFSPAVSALEFGAVVAELDFGVSMDELDSPELSSLADEVLSQLAQKKLVRARAIFFQCL